MERWRDRVAVQAWAATNQSHNVNGHPSKCDPLPEYQHIWNYNTTNRHMSPPLLSTYVLVSNTHTQTLTSHQYKHTTAETTAEPDRTTSWSRTSSRASFSCPTPQTDHSITNTT